MIDPTPHPSHPGHHGFLTIFLCGGRYWIRDEHGHLGSTDELEDLHFALYEQAQAPPSNKFGPWPRARDLVEPGRAERLAAAREAMAATIPVLPPKERVRPGSIRLEDLGL